MRRVLFHRSCVVVAAALVLLAGCRDDAGTLLPPQPEPPEGTAAALVRCSVEVAAARMTCETLAPAPGGVSADLILGGQNTYVRLANGPIEVADGMLGTPVTVQNLTAQAMGTADGTTLSPRGVRVFFHSGPTSGVEVANADGTEMYTGPGQPYFQYDQVLAPHQVSGERSWSFTLNGASSFSFVVFVVAEVPSETGLLRLARVEGPPVVPGAWDVKVEGTTITVVGDRGGIIRSTDGGATWRGAYTGVPFDEVGRQSDRHRFQAVGGRGRTLLALGYGLVSGTRFYRTSVRSTDGGASWAPVTITSEAGTTGPVWGDGTTFIAAMHEGEEDVPDEIFRSTDGGATWTSVHSGWSVLTSIWGQDSLVVAVSWNAQALRSTDLGATWSAVNTGSAYSLNGVWGVDSLVIAVGDNGTIRRSVNGGASWAHVFGGMHSRLNSVWGDGSVFVAVGNGGAIIRSIDGGLTWAVVISGTAAAPALRGVSGDGSLLAAVGADGSILRSVDAGATWEAVVFSGGRTRLRGVWGTGSTAVAVGDSGLIRRSADGGATWGAVSSGTTSTLNAVWGSGSSILAVGQAGTIRRSTDEGATWTSSPSGTTGNLRGVLGVGSTVFVVGPGVRRSTDDGVTWRHSVSGLGSLGGIWATEHYLVAVGADVIIRSTDQGASWAVVSPANTYLNLNAVAGQGAVVVAVGDNGAIHRSTDSGATWSRVTGIPDIDLHGISARSDGFVAVGNAGTVIRSVDGGQSWHRLWGGATNDLMAIWMAGPSDGWIVGDYGTILRGQR